MPTIYPNLEARFNAPGPKRILSLDGGGIRGALSLGYLERLELLLRVKHQNPDLKLCDYFDLIGGTSTGAIIAAALAIGKSVKEVKDMYLKLGADIFGARKGVFGISIKQKYDEKPLKRELQKVFGDIRLGDEGENGLLTGICIVTKRLDTFSTWPLTNHPGGKYFERNRFLLRDVVRASTAAPTYFMPEHIDLGGNQQGVFVDGGLSMMNNPALQMLLMVTSQGYPFHWKTGEDQLQVISIGTGTRDYNLCAKKYSNPNLLEIASLAPEQFMHDASELVETVLQWISDSPTARSIDRVFGSMEGDLLHGKQAMSYRRYNMKLDRVSLEAIGMQGLSDQQIGELSEMDDADNRFILAEIGDKAAQFQMHESHFDKHFLRS